MKFYYLKEHSMVCELSKRKVDKSSLTDWFCPNQVCELNKNYLIFYHNLDFHLIIYYDCIKHGRNSADFLEDILNRSFNSKSKKGNFNRSQVFDKCFDSMRKDVFIMDEKLIDVNYIYSDNANKTYSIIRKYKFDLDLDHNEKLLENATKAKKELLKKYSFSRELFFNTIDELVSANLIPNYNEKFIHNSISNLIKQLNKQTK